ncbi:hypothetical protein BT96DRAFT_950271 [Gymnopus androsaceus JB14]|uniref:Uncharacterized protein n=1 Tax=Gymnopus androsaceus JB14 TaxID=1447944 RepID=A0A6A4GH82_9AGAR|nr:hypothetical protein BT96DRAFT_950271 [Gymnopus androsaceus JB14]
MDTDILELSSITMPVLVGDEARCRIPDAVYIGKMDLRSNPKKSEKALAAEEQAKEALTYRKTRGQIIHKPIQAGSALEHGPSITETVQIEPVSKGKSSKLADLTNHIPDQPSEKSGPVIDPPSLTHVVSSGRTGINVEQVVRDNYSNDSVFRDIIAKPKDYRNYEVIDQTVYLKLIDRTLLCIPDIFVNKRKLREILIDEAHSLLAHLSMKKNFGLSKGSCLVEDHGSRCTEIL